MESLNIENIVRFGAKMSAEIKKIYKTTTKQIKNYSTTENKMEIILCFIAIFIFLYVLDIIGILIMTILTLIYPMLRTFHTIKLKRVENYESVLIYWIFFACFTIVENLFGFFLRMIPLYSMIKMIFMAWAIFPQTDGSQIVYQKYLLPILEKYNYNKFDKFFNIVTVKVSEGLKEFQSE